MDFKHTIVAALVATPLLCLADDPVITVSADTPVLNKYVWRGVNFLNDPVFQPSLNFASRGWNLNLWGNYDIDNAKRFDEYDFTFSYESSLPFGDWSLGYIDYAFPNSLVRHTREVYGTFTFANEFSPYVQLNFDTDEVDGFYGRLGASTEFETSYFNLGFHSWFGYGDKRMNNALYGNNRSGLADYGIEATLSRQLSLNTTGYFKIGYTALLDSKHLQGQTNRNNLTFGLGIGIGF